MIFFIEVSVHWNVDIISYSGSSECEDIEEKVEKPAKVSEWPTGDPLFSKSSERSSSWQKFFRNIKWMHDPCSDSWRQIQTKREEKKLVSNQVLFTGRWFGSYLQTNRNCYSRFDWRYHIFIPGVDYDLWFILFPWQPKCITAACFNYTLFGTNSLIVPDEVLLDEIFDQLPSKPTRIQSFQVCRL